MRALHLNLSIVAAFVVGCTGVLDGSSSSSSSSTPLRRLTSVEYRHTVADLFPGVSLPDLTLVPDNRLQGLENQSGQQAPSDLLISRYHQAARTIVEALAAEGALERLAACSEARDAACGRRFVGRFGRRAFRRPLTDDETAAFARFFTEGPSASNFDVSMQLVIQAMLQSPQFLYRPELGASGAALTPYETASRLSYLLWATMPDAELFEAAAENRLGTAEELDAQVERMLADPKARRGVLNFHRQWLDFDLVDRVTKRAEDAFDPSFRSAVRESAERFVWDTFEGGGTVSSFMTSTRVFADARIASLYGLPAPANDFDPVSAPEDERAGILTHPIVLTTHGYAEYPSPVLRGVFVMSRILCAPPQPPPPGIPQITPDHGDPTAPRTNREAYAAATRGPGCDACHSVINPIGFAFETYDTMGRFRTTDNELPVDASGSALGYTFSNAVELAQSLATSEDVSNCMLDTWVKYALGGGPLVEDAAFRSDLAASFAASSFELRALVKAIATHPKFALGTDARSTP